MLFILGHEKDVEINFWGGGTREAASLDVSNEILLVTFVRIILSEGYNFEDFFFPFCGSWKTPQKFVEPALT